MANRLITSYLRVNLFRQVSCIAFLASFLFILKSEGRVIKLNLNLDSDQVQGYQEDGGGFWRAISCKYNDNEDFPALKNSSCFVGFHGLTGAALPQLNSIRASGSGMAAGEGKIRVQGERSVIGQEYDYDIMEFNSEESDVNLEIGEIVKVAIDFQESYAFRFELTVQTAGSTAILDSIEIKIDIGDEAAESSSPVTLTPDFLLDDKSDITYPTVLVDSLLVSLSRKDEPILKPGGASALSPHHALYITGASTLALFLAAKILQIN